MDPSGRNSSEKQKDDIKNGNQEPENEGRTAGRTEVAETQAELNFKDQANSFHRQPQVKVVPSRQLASLLPEFKNQVFGAETEMSTEDNISQWKHHRSRPIAVTTSNEIGQVSSRIVFADAHLVGNSASYGNSHSSTGRDFNLSAQTNMETTKPSLESQHSMNKNVIWLSVVVLIAAGVVVGGVCGSGLCTSSSSSSTSLLETSSPIMVAMAPSNPPSLSLSNMPSILPTLQANNMVIYDLLNALTFSDVPIRANSNTTVEEQAAQWLIYQDTVDWSGNLLRMTQRYALATVWFGLNGSTSWTNRKGWMTEDDECTWFGVTCSDDDSNMVTELVLANNFLQGELPVDVALLTNLTKLQLDNNPNLMGSLPLSIDNLQQMEYFNVGYCSMGGSLPNSIGQLSHLEYLILRDNKFNDILPSSIGNCTNLKHFVTVSAYKRKLRYHYENSKSSDMIHLYTSS